MSTADIDLKLYFRKKHTPPPSVLLLTLPNERLNKQQQQHRVSPPIELRSRQEKQRQATSHIAGLRVNNSDTHDTSTSYYGWQRYSDKTTQITPAPDVAYRYTYLEETKKEKSAITNADRRSPSQSPSPRSQQSQQRQPPRVKTASSSSNYTSDSSQRKSYHEYRTVYDYIRESIKQMERQRNLKQKNFSVRVKRPQNDDVILRRVLGEKKSSASSKISSISTNDQRNPQSLVNYINHSREQIRVLHTTTPNQPYHREQINSKYDQERTSISQNQNDSLEQRQYMMMTATVGNS
jgi:hypothetical protein